MQRLAQGDPGALTALVARHGPAMRRMTEAIVGPDASKDACQESLIAAFLRASTWNPAMGPVRPWLLAIARHEAYRQAPRAQHHAIDEVPLVELGVRAGWSASDPESMVARAEDHERLAWAIASLAPSDREVLILRDLEGVSGDEAAQALGLELQGMKSRLHRARLRLMAALREGGSLMEDEQRLYGGIRCGEVLEALPDYLDGQVASGVREQIDTHLRQCAVCERFGGRYKRTVATLRSHLGAAAAVDEATYRRLIERWNAGPIRSPNGTPRR